MTLDLHSLYNYTGRINDINRVIVDRDLISNIWQNLTLYQRVVALGIEHSIHYSDLYIPVNDTTRQLVKDCNIIAVSIGVFKHQVDGRLWYDIAFGYDPYWNKRAA